MRCILIQPPLCDPSCPPLGLAYLAASLAKAGIEHYLEDLNLDFIANVSGENNEDNLENYRSSSAYLASIKQLRADIEAGNAFDSSLTYEPFTIAIPGSEGNLSAMRAAACDPNGHLQHWLRQSSAVQRLATLKPDWVGISISFFGQLPAAFAIANYCRLHLRTVVIFGGGLFNDFEKYLNLAAQPWVDVDGVILGAGESLVTQMVRLSDGRIAPPINRIDFPGKKWSAKAPGETPPPFPDFSRFPLDSYRAPGRVLPFRAFSSCTWDRCTFCADSKYRYHTATEHGRVSSITQQVIRLVKKYDAKGIYFLDAELPGSFMMEYAKGIKKEFKFPPRWGGNSRFSSRLADPATGVALFSAGCRLLRFGLESGSLPILKRMAKGITPHLASQVLSALHQAGIVTHIYLMKGFPGETEADWKTTCAFLYDNAEYIDMFNISSFQLYSDSPLAIKLGANVEIMADENHWTHPFIRGSVQNLKEDAHLFRQLEHDFFTYKPFTRCFFCTADTLLLAEKFSLSFR